MTSSISSGDNTDEEPDYILGRPMTQAEYEAQLAPMQNLTAFAPEDNIYSATDDTAAAGASMERSTGYPATYDSRTQNLVTSVTFSGKTWDPGIFPKNIWHTSGPTARMTLWEIPPMTRSSVPLLPAITRATTKAATDGWLPSFSVPGPE